MSDRPESLRAPDPLQDALASHLSPTTMDRLRQVIEHSGLSIREILSQAIDVAWDVQLSGDLTPRVYLPSTNDQASEPKAPAVMPAEGSERPLAHVELGDIVRLRNPYHPVIGTDRQRGPFRFGIVADTLTVLPDGRTRNVSLYLYDPERREIFLGPNAIAEFVDFHCSEFELYKRARERGYIPLVPPLPPGQG